jgi:AcrR family transcriptional regulator
MTTPRPGSRAEQRRRTETRILEAATQVFFSAGYDRATIRAVASAAGVDAGLVMHYFGSKQELFRRVIEAVPVSERPGRRPSRSSPGSPTGWKASRSRR